MTDLRVDWGGAEVSGVFPKRIPDLFVGRPVILSGRCRGEIPDRIRILGEVDGRAEELLAGRASAGARPHPGIRSVWARTMIADLEYTASRSDDGELGQLILDTALEHGLLSSRTAFVAVDGSHQTEGSAGTTVPVPVRVPAGVRYDTTVGDR